MTQTYLRKLTEDNTKLSFELAKEKEQAQEGLILAAEQEKTLLEKNRKLNEQLEYQSSAGEPPPVSRKSKCKNKSRNRALRQDYPIFADEPNIITKLPLNEVIGEQKSTAEKKGSPINKNKKQMTSNYEFRKPRSRQELSSSNTLQLKKPT